MLWEYKFKRCFPSSISWRLVADVGRFDKGLAVLGDDKFVNDAGVNKISQSGRKFFRWSALSRRELRRTTCLRNFRWRDVINCVSWTFLTVHFLWKICPVNLIYKAKMECHLIFSTWPKLSKLINIPPMRHVAAHCVVPRLTLINEPIHSRFG